MQPIISPLTHRPLPPPHPLFPSPTFLPQLLSILLLSLQSLLVLEVLVRSGAGLDGWEAGTEVGFIVLGFIWGVAGAGAGEGVWARGFVVEVWGVGGC